MLVTESGVKVWEVSVTARTAGVLVSYTAVSTAMCSHLPKRIGV